MPELVRSGEKGLESRDMAACTQVGNQITDPVAKWLVCAIRLLPFRRPGPVCPGLLQPGPPPEGPRATYLFRCPFPPENPLKDVT